MLKSLSFFFLLASVIFSYLLGVFVIFSLNIRVFDVAFFCIFYHIVMMTIFVSTLNYMLVVMKVRVRLVFVPLIFAFCKKTERGGFSSLEFHKMDVLIREYLRVHVLTRYGDGDEEEEEEEKEDEAQVDDKSRKKAPVRYFTLRLRDSE